MDALATFWKETVLIPVLQFFAGPDKLSLYFWKHTNQNNSTPLTVKSERIFFWPLLKNNWQQKLKPDSKSETILKDTIKNLRVVYVWVISEKN